MKINITFGKGDSELDNALLFDSLAEQPYNIELKSLVDTHNIKTEIIDTLIIPTTSDQDKYQIIHFTSTGSFVIHYINKNQGDSSTKIYTSIIDTDELYEKNTKYLYYNEVLNCLLVKLKNSITLLSLINFKKINKIIERNVDIDMKLNIIQNNAYVVLTYQVADTIKFFIWDSKTSRYLKLKILNLTEIKKGKGDAKLISIEFIDDVETDVLLVFDNDVIIYSFDTSIVKSKDHPLKLLHNAANNKHSEIINMIDNGIDNADHDNHSIKSNKKKTVYVKFIGTLKCSATGVIRVIDNRGNVYIHHHVNRNVLMYEDKILLENEKDLIDYIEPDFRNNKTLFVYTNSGKNVDICYNNYSVAYLDTSVADYTEYRYLKIINDFVILIDYKQKCITAVEINYNLILEYSSFDSKPMNLINLINKIFEEESNEDITDYLDLIRSAYSRLLILRKNLALSNDSVLNFFNEKAIKYLLPLDIVIEINTDDGHYKKGFINYLLEIKRYLLNIEKGDADKYNTFFNDKVIIDNYDFFIYNELDTEDGLDGIFETIDTRLLDYYIDKDVDLVNIFVNNDNNKCRLKSDYILTNLLNLLKSNKTDNFVGILKIIITYCIRNGRYKQGFDIILNLNQFIVHIDIPKDYLFKVAVSYLIEMFAYIFSTKTLQITKLTLEQFFSMVSQTMSLNSEIVNNSLYLKSIFLQSNDVINFDNLDKDVFAYLCSEIHTFRPKTFYRDFLEFYTLTEVSEVGGESNNNVILSTLISYYIETDDFFTFPSILNKLRDLLTGNVKRWMPFEVMSLLNDKESSFGSGWEKEKWFGKYMQIKCLVWKEMQEDNKILQYYYEDKENGLATCLKYIHSLESDKQRYTQSVTALGTFMTDNYQEWMVYIDEFADVIDIKNIPGFIKLSDLNTLMLKSILHKYDNVNAVRTLINASDKVVKTQIKYLNNKKLNEFTEINQ